MVEGKGKRLQSLLTLRGFQLTLPNSDTVPAHLCQFALFLLVTFLIPSDLIYPELPIGMRNPTALRVHNHIIHLTSSIRHPWQRHVVSMPEAAIHKDTRPVFPQHQVRMSGQPPMI